MSRLDWVKRKHRAIFWWHDRAWRHEMTCWECRVTWKSWVQRNLGIQAGHSPHGPRPDGMTWSREVKGWVPEPIHVPWYERPQA